MSRVRSPNYPSMSLPDALQRIRVIHAAERHLAAPREVIAKHLGYGGLNGASIKVISALTKYGLLEDVSGDKLRVSPLALSILYPKDDDEKRRALQSAAYSPALFMEIAQEWEGGDPSDQNLRSYLVRRNFAEDAVDRVIQSYRETMALVTPESPAHDSPAEPQPGPQQWEPQTVYASQPVASSQPSPSMHISGASLAGEITADEPYRLTLSRGGIDVVARLTDEATVDELIRALEAWKVLMKPAGVARRPADEPEAE